MPTTAPLRIVSLNAWGLPWPISRAPLVRMEAIASAIPALDADVVALQEVWTLDARARLVSGLRGAGYRHVWHREAAQGGSGLLVLSRLPLRNVRFTPFTLNGFPHRILHGDYWGGKGFVECEVEVGGGSVVVLVTHLHAGYGRKGPDDEYLGHRVAQVIEIASALRDTDAPVVAAGDFNFTEDSDESRILLGLTRLRDPAVELDRRQGTILANHPYRGAGFPEERIDYVFAAGGDRRGARAVSIERVLDGPLDVQGVAGAYSDHAGLLAEIEIGGPPTGRSAPGTGVLELAARRLAEGRSAAEARRRANRGVALTGGGAAAAAIGAVASRRPQTRRGVVRAGLLGLGSLGLLAGGGAAYLSEHFGSRELRGYETVSNRLAAFGARRERG